MSERLTGVKLQHFVDGLSSYEKRDCLAWGYNSYMVRIIIGTALMNYIWENMD